MKPYSILLIISAIMYSCNSNNSTKHEVKDIEHSIAEKNVLREMSAHYRGNRQSEITLWYITDYDCESCREFQPLFYLLYNKFKSDISFAQINLSLHSPLKGIAAESAARQNNFWEMNELLYSSAIKDTSDIIAIAEQIGLDTDQFISDMNDSILFQKYIEANKKLITMGVVTTPTIYINNKPFENPTQINEIEVYIKKQLSD